MRDSFQGKMDSGGRGENNGWRRMKRDEGVNGSERRRKGRNGWMEMGKERGRNERMEEGDVLVQK